MSSFSARRVAARLFAVASLAMLAGAPPSQGADDFRRPGGRTLFEVDFSSGLSGYPDVVNGEDIRIVDDPLGVPRKVARFTVHDHDAGPTQNPRAQVSTPPLLVPGKDIWAGWSTMFPRRFPATLSGWVAIESFYGAPFKGSSPFGLTVKTFAGRTMLVFQRNRTYGYDIPWQIPLIRGRWLDFVVHQKLSSRRSVGFVELYLNTGAGWEQQTLLGRKRLYMKTRDRSNRAGANEHRLANYRQRGMLDVLSLYHASHRLGTSFSAVAPSSYRR